jgi:hypothetical protein
MNKMAAFLVAFLVVHTLAVSQKPAEPSVEGAKAALVERFVGEGPCTSLQCLWPWSALFYLSF